MQESLERNAAYALRHFKFGWWSLLFFLSLGIVLETMHGFKIGWYLDVSNETRRLMWTLAHAHGTLTALINIGFGATLRLLPAEKTQLHRIASPNLIAGAILLPAGFFIGGIKIYVNTGDPNLGILLVPVGAALLFIGVLVTALTIRSMRTEKTD